MLLGIVFSLLVSSTTIDQCHGRSSPIATFANYQHSVELSQDVADLWWSIDDAETEITFELHIKTTGWIALGISPGTVLCDASILVVALTYSLFSWWNEGRRYRSRMD